MITESDVVAFFDAKCQELRERTGNNYVCITLSRASTKFSGYCGEWAAYVDGGKSVTKPSLDIAMAESCRAINPQVRAEEMRKQAHALLAQAEKLAP